MFSLFKSNLRAWLAVLACGLGLHPGFAQQPQPLIEVKGTVVDAVSRQPIARVLVNANDDAALTDNDGNFVLHLQLGRNFFRLLRPGYHQMANANMLYGRMVAEGMARLQFTLVPDAAVSGHITLAEGEDPLGIHVALYRRGMKNRHRGWQVVARSTSNSQGAFYFGGLAAPGEYLLYTDVSHDPGESPKTARAASGYAPSYYPGTNDPSAAGVLSLTPGQQAQVDLELARQPFYRVSLHLAGLAEEGFHYRTQVFDPSGRLVDQAVHWNAEEGAFDILLPNGRYFAEAQSSSGYGRTEFTVAGAPLPSPVILVAPLHPLYVHLDQSALSAEAKQRLGRVPFLLGLEAVSSFDESHGYQALRPATASGAAELLELEHVHPGRYWVNVMSVHGYVSSISAGGVDLAREPLVIGPGGSSAPLEITLRDDTGTISGQVADSQAADSSSQTDASKSDTANGVHLYAIPLFPSVARIPEMHGPATGPIELSEVPPGSYRVLALDAAIEIDPTDSQDMQKWSTSGQVVTVEAGSTASVQLQLIHLGPEGDPQ